MKVRIELFKAVPINLGRLRTERAITTCEVVCDLEEISQVVLSAKEQGFTVTRIEKE